jgi:hypothetical protein
MNVLLPWFAALLQGGSTYTSALTALTKLAPLIVPAVILKFELLLVLNMEDRRPDWLGNKVYYYYCCTVILLYCHRCSIAGYCVCTRDRTRQCQRMQLAQYAVCKLSRVMYVRVSYIHAVSYAQYSYVDHSCQPTRLQCLLDIVTEDSASVDRRRSISYTSSSMYNSSICQRRCAVSVWLMRGEH